MSSDPFNLQRFVEAQAGVWNDVKAELAAGRKTSHWMWFIFPQLGALGRSSTARFYGVGGAEEARAYLAHEVLGARLREACALLLQLPTASAPEVFGDVDAIKLRSCLTLFDAVAGGGVFHECLCRFFDGKRDAITLELLAPPFN